MVSSYNYRTEFSILTTQLSSFWTSEKSKVRAVASKDKNHETGRWQGSFLFSFYTFSVFFPPVFPHSSNQTSLLSHCVKLIYQESVPLIILFSGHYIIRCGKQKPHTHTHTRTHKLALGGKHFWWVLSFNLAFIFHTRGALDFGVIQQQRAFPYKASQLTRNKISQCFRIPEIRFVGMCVHSKDLRRKLIRLQNIQG